MQTFEKIVNNVDDQSLQIRNEVARILYSDQSEIECAIQSKIESIDECLTSRSNFLSIFQQMLKKQMGIKEDNDNDNYHHDQSQNQQNFTNLEYQSLHYKNQRQDKFQSKKQFYTSSQNIPTNDYTSRLIQQKQNIISKESQAQTARQVQVENSFADLKRQIWQSSFGFTSRQSEFYHQTQIDNEEDSRQDKINKKKQFSIISTQTFKQLYTKNKELVQNCRQIREFCLQQLNCVKLQMKQIVSSSLGSIVQIINSIYQKKIQQLLEQTQKFKNQTRRLKQEISFRNLANSSFFNQDLQNQLSSQTMSLKESQRSDYIQNQFVNIGIPQIKSPNLLIYEPRFPIMSQIHSTLNTNKDDRNLDKNNNFITSLSNQTQKFSNYNHLNLQKNNYNDNMNFPLLKQTLLQRSRQFSNINSFQTSFNSFSSDKDFPFQAPKNEWKQIKFSLKKSQKQNQFHKHKNSNLVESNQCMTKKSYNNFYDFEPLRRIQIKYPPILDGFASISQQNLSYKGNWKNGLMHGKGKLLTNSFAYEGEFWYGSFQGNGTYKTNVLQFKGQFKNHKIDGNGCLMLKKQKIHGLWKQNKFIRRT